MRTSNQDEKKYQGKKHKIDIDLQNKIYLV
jgi:hypothetical protein